MWTLLLRKEKMDKTRLEKMEELDAKIEKINYDLLGLESRKKEIEEKKFSVQQEIEKLEEEKKTILDKTDKMNKLQKAIYIMFNLKNDLKQVELLNAKVEENRKEKDNIQNKIDIQNKLYADTIKEKDKYIEQRRLLYIENTNTLQEEKAKVTSHTQDLAKIDEIAKKYKKSNIMIKIRQVIETEMNKLLGNKEETKEKSNRKEVEAQDEME